MFFSLRCLLVLLGLGAAPFAGAGVVRVELTQPRDLGASGHEELSGQLHFEIDPALPQNALIADLDLAPRNAAGRVAFQADLRLLRPRDPARANGTTRVEIPNRGGKAGLADWVVDYGFTVVQVSWEFDIPASIDTAVPGVRFTEHLPQTARLADRLTAVRTVNHRVVDEHAFATNLVHTGRMISGTVTYPSLGSLIAHQRGAASEDVPPYMLIGYPNVSRGPGFLGPRHASVYLVDTESGPAGFTQPEGLSSRQLARRAQLAASPASPAQEIALAHYAELQEQARRWAEPKFMRNFNLAEEPAALRESYGGEFGQRCLLARRLTQAGVRFIEVSHNLNFINGTGWDTHFEGQLNQHALIREIDTALAALIRDLEDKGLLDKTLIATGTEFGRPAEFDNRGGRGHQSSAFSLVLAGGGLQHRGARGVTDELGANIVENPVSIPDFHATIHAALGIDPGKELHEAGRPVPITDGGRPIAALFG